MLETPLLLIFPVIMLTAAFMDLFTMTIPNRISLVLLIAFCVVVPFAGLSWQSLLQHVGVGAAMLVFSMLLFSFRLIGGGDAKLLAVSALWIGPAQALPYLAYVAIMGGLLSVAILMYRNSVPQIVVIAWSAPSWARKLHERDAGIPYGIAIAAAAVLIYPSTALFLSLSA